VILISSILRSAFMVVSNNDSRVGHGFVGVGSRVRRPLRSNRYDVGAKRPLHVSAILGGDVVEQRRLGAHIQEDESYERRLTRICLVVL